MSKELTEEMYPQMARETADEVDGLIAAQIVKKAVEERPQGLTEEEHPRLEHLKKRVEQSLHSAIRDAERIQRLEQALSNVCCALNNVLRPYDGRGVFGGAEGSKKPAYAAALAALSTTPVLVARQEILKAAVLFLPKGASPS